MVFNDELIFIHIGKTGGMSCSAYLLNNLNPPVYDCHLEALNRAKKETIEGVTPMPLVGRHCNLEEALEFIEKINGKTLKDFKKVVAVIRHPYTLEHSYYNYLKRPQTRKRRAGARRLIALNDGDFKTFIEQAGYHRPNHKQDDFVRINNEIPDCVQLVKFEELSDAFPKAVAAFLKDNASFPFPHHNKTPYETDLRKELTDEVKALIYQKHRFMFDSGLYSTDEY